MAETAARVEEVLNGFAESMSRLLLDQYQQHLAELDLTLPQAQVLRILWRSGPVPTGQLAQELRTSAPAITQLTDRLVRKGLLERRAAEADRRTVLVALSAKGRRQVSQFRARRGRIFSGALAELDESEQAQIVAALEKVVAALRRYEAREALGGQTRPASANV